ncbi:acyl-CoA dehydrogenase family protein [Nocardiopsis lambiniae]|uniref:Oxidoreductase n=1 Tax=Nocardiopsis lambiniae TaxID=3075539 RepID=A0ABU2MC63_9ACTN|nr:acyl-CoA dehydrogenase family protein [Nocardiopsis sp. DSM 44743]MDT0330163.1 oxidoreductase [Nocardiopsis sp. DSM 44743]
MDTEQSTFTPSGAELDRARALIPLLQANAAQGEQERRLTDETVKALTEEGMFKLLIPRRYGGYETSLRTLLDVTSTLSEGDGASGWLAAVCNSCAWMASLFPERARDEVFGSGSAPIVSGVVAPTAKTRRVDGGFTVTGRWNYNSGSWHADWAVLGVPLTDDDGAVVDQGMVLVPASDYTVEETWFTAGLRATGSNTLVAQDVFVPDHRVLSVPPLFAGTHAADEGETPLYRSPFAPFVSTVIVGPLLGLGRAALETVVRRAPDKAIAFTFFQRQTDSVAYQVAVAEAALRIDTAHLHAHRAADAVDRAAAQGHRPDALTRARIRADLGHAVENTTAAIDGLMYVHGSGGFAEADPLQRVWRDAHMAARHAVVQPSIGKEVYGKALLGVDEKVSPMV